MAIQTATPLAAAYADFLDVFDRIAYRIREHSPSAARTSTFTIVTDTAGTITFTWTDGNGTVTKAIAAGVV